jgi:SAM-dependent methyltransferase
MPLTPAPSSPDSPYSAGLARHFQAFANRERAQRYVDLLRRGLPTGAPVLEIGAGLGHVALGLAEAGHPVWALEPDADMRGQLQTLAGGLTSSAAALTPLPWAATQATPDLPEPVAAASAFSLLHLLDESAQAGLLAWAGRQLQPGGWLWLELPMQGSERSSGDWQDYGERPLGTARLRMHTRVQGSDQEGWCTDWRFELSLGAQCIEQVQQRWLWQALSPERLQTLLAGWQVLDDWADEVGAPYRPARSARRLMRLKPATG